MVVGRCTQGVVPYHVGNIVVGMGMRLLCLLVGLLVGRDQQNNLQVEHWTSCIQSCHDQHDS